jgi:hypothetical protein
VSFAAIISENVQFEDQKGDGRITLIRIVGRQDVKRAGGWKWLRIVSNEELWY